MSIFLTPAERSALRRVITFLNVDWKAFARSVLFGVLGLGSAIALAATSAWLIARASQHPPVLYLTVAATSVRLFGVSRALMRYLQRLASHRVALTGMDSLRLRLYQELSTSRVDKITTLRRGDLLTRAGADVDAVGDLVVKTILPATVTTFVSILTVLGISLISPAAGIVLALCLLVSGGIAPLLTMRSARLTERASLTARTDLSAGVLTIMEGASELSISGTLPASRTYIQNAEDRYESAIAQASRIAGFSAGIDRLAMGASVVAALLIGIPATVEGAIPAVALAVLALTPLASFEGTAELGPAAMQLVRSASAAQRIVELLGDAAPASGHSIPHSDTAPLLAAHDLAIGWPDGPPIAENINLTLTSGQCIAVVGPSGIGKTTLLLTLAGMLPPKAGIVTLNGVDIWNADRDDVTSSVTMTAEDAHIFATTVLENIRVSAPDIDDESIGELLSHVGLKNWLDELPDGAQTMIGAGGTTVSGGERRRLLMARALASPAPLLLLDEASEHLDAHTADTLMTTICGETQESHRGVLIVTHRLSALTHADEVLILDTPSPGDRARIIERGTHREVSERSEHYRWALQQEKR